MTGQMNLQRLTRMQKKKKLYYRLSLYITKLLVRMDILFIKRRAPNYTGNN